MSEIVLNKILIVWCVNHSLYRATPFAAKGVALHTKGCSHLG